MNKDLPKIHLELRPELSSFKTPDSVLALWDKSIEARAPSKAEVQIDLLGVIGVHVTDRSVRAALLAAGKSPVRVVINSPGGSAIEGIAIYNMLLDHPAFLTVEVLALAASVASLIAMAGDRIEMRSASRMMIHSAHAMIEGNQNDLREYIEILDAVDQDVAKVYAARSGKPIEQILQMMKKDTYMNAEQAVANGFADAVLADEKKKVKAMQIENNTFSASTHPALLAASGDRRPVVRLSASPPGASGTQNEPASAGFFTSRKEPPMNVAEQISSFEAKRAASAERMTAIMAKAAEVGATLDETQTQEYDGLASEVKAVDEHLVRLKAHEVQIIAKAKPITAAIGGDPEASTKARAHSGIISVGPRLEPGIPLARMAIALHRSRGDRAGALAEVQANRRWMDQTPEVAKVLMTAVPAADTTTAGWASELVYAENMQNEFIEFLRPMTILGRLTGVRKVPFNVRMGSLTGGTTGYWVGQGKAIPMSKGTTGSLTLGIAKAAGLAAYDDELLRSSSPSIETMVRDDLAKAVAQVIDVAFIDPNNGGLPNEKPASILYNVTPTTPSGTNAAAVVTDVAAVFAAAIAASLDPMSGVWVMSPTTALKLSLMQTTLGVRQYPDISINGGTWQGLPVIVSPNVVISGSPQFGNMIVLILQNEIILADDGQVSVDISNEASLEFLDNPTNLSTGATAPTTVVSLFQTQSWAIKCVKYCNWTKRRTAAAAFIQAALYS